jgi:hypothetical protein
MIVMVTEVNMWEREKWNYLMDIDKVGGAVMNDLMIFVRLANEDFKKQSDLGRGLFAASRYLVKFYDCFDNSDRPSVGCSNGYRMYLSNSACYKNGLNDFREKTLSPRRMRGVMAEMRDKNNNRIYKDFEYLFLKK